jgi:hypothetical protein
LTAEMPDSIPTTGWALIVLLALLIVESIVGIQ